MLSNLQYFESLEDMLPFVLAFILAMAISISIHEFAHAYIAYKLGDDTAYLSGRLTLNPLAHINPMGLLCFVLVGFGWATPVPVNPLKFKKYRLGMLCVSIAGVCTNIIFAFMLCGLEIFLVSSGALLKIFEFSQFLYLFLLYFLTITITMNISLFFFNLIPIPPLDGFNCINSFAGSNKFIKFIKENGLYIFLGIIAISYIFPNFNLLGNLVDFIETKFLNFWSNAII